MADYFFLFTLCNEYPKERIISKISQPQFCLYYYIIISGTVLAINFYWMEKFTQISIIYTKNLKRFTILKLMGYETNLQRKEVNLNACEYNNYAV